MPTFSVNKTLCYPPSTGKQQRLNCQSPRTIGLAGLPVKNDNEQQNHRDIHLQ